MSNPVDSHGKVSSHQHNQKTGGAARSASHTSAKKHASYLRFIHNPQTAPNPTFDDIKSYLRDAYLGFVPIPLTSDNLAKSYAFFKGSAHKQTLNKILSDNNVAVNLIPGLQKVAQAANFSLGRLHDYVCLEEESASIEQLQRKAQIVEKKAGLYIEEFFQNPEVVKSALKAVSKKQWAQLLVKPPSNPHLLKATASLSSEDFFKGGMHLAFLEIEPEIYSSLKSHVQKDPYIGFKAKKYLRILLELEYTLQNLIEQQRNQQRLKDDAKLYRGSGRESLILESEVRKTGHRSHNLHLDEKPEKPSFIQKMIREELGYKTSVDREQVQKILQAAEEILNTPKVEKPSDFLHKKHPEEQKPTFTLDTMDLSTR